MLINDLATADWSTVINSSNVDDAYNSFINKLTSSLDTHIPLTTNRRSNYKKIPIHPWITKSLLRSINRKNNLYYKYITKPNNTSRSKYTSYKNTLTSLLRIAKKEYYTSQLNLYKNDMKIHGKSLMLQ